MIDVNQEKKEVLNAFVNSLIRRLGITSVLVLDHSGFKLFDSIHCEIKKVLSISEGVPATGKWDLIVADLPIGMKSELNGRTTSYIAKTILTSVDLLNVNGYIFSVGEPLLMRDDIRGIRALLKDEASVSALIDSPDGLLKPYTNLRVPFFLIKKGETVEEFVGELLDADQVNRLANNLIDRVSGNSLEQGIFIKPSQFDGFSRWKVRQQIQALETEYKEFGTRRMGELLKSINSIKPKSEFENLPNSLYIHKLGTKAVTSSIENLSSNHSNYYQCECNDEIVDAKYLESFFGSRLGKLILSSLNTGSFIPNITLQNLSDTEISIPPLKAQLEIINSISKLRKVKDVIGQFEDDLAVNPIGSDQTLKQIDFMLEVVGALADSDKIMSLIRGGESKQTEFKETLTLDVKKQTKEKYIELPPVSE